MWYIGSLGCLLVILAASAVIGTAFINICLPWRLRPSAREFLAPTLGLTLLMIPATIIGWLGHGFRCWICFPITAVMVLVGCWRMRRSNGGLRGRELRPAGRLAGFAALASYAILGQLLRYNAYSPFSDIWVYLCQTQWLQRHGYLEHAVISAHQPVAAAVATWQAAGLRIGSSFLLGWLQAVFGVEWSYQIYPVAAALAVVCGALAVGGIVRAACPGHRQAAWWSALAAGTTLNGFVCGAADGFFPQTVGLAFATAALALRGMEIGAWRTDCNANMAASPTTFARRLRTALPLSTCLAAVFYCYPEVSPFVVAAIGASYLFPWLRGRAQWRHRVLSLGMVALVSIILAAPEAGRAFRSLQIQAKAITGFPVAWSPGGFLAHSLGGRAAPFEGSVWFYEGGWTNVLFGAAPVVCIALLLLRTRRRNAIPSRARIDSSQVLRWSALVPTAALAALCAAAFFYFRWVVPNPWPQAIGSVGQSFSEYKLSLWASPALMAVVAVGCFRLARRWRTLATGALAVWCAAGIGVTNHLLLAWAAPIRLASGETQDPFGSYRAFCEALSRQPAKESFYLEATAGDLGSIKQRQLLAYFLQDRELLGNWAIDDYMPMRQLGFLDREPPQDADWVVRYHPDDPSAPEATPRLCRLTVARPASASHSLIDVTGGYGRESTGDGRLFYWTAHELQMVWRGSAGSDDEFTAGVRPPAQLLRLSFTVHSRVGAQTITVRIMEGTRQMETFTVPADEKEASFVSEPFIDTESEVRAVFTGSGAAVYASATDPREISFLVASASLKTVQE